MDKRKGKVMVSKRIFDIFFSFFGLLFLLPILLLIVVIASIDTSSFGIFFQTRIGQYGTKFTIYKIKTFKNKKPTPFGTFIRRKKIDELPQLINILIGDMSFVGPRPDIEGFYDALDENSKQLLQLKPGLTCQASIKYSNEDEILALQNDPETYNKTVIFPDKIKMNLDYFQKRSLLLDLKIIWRTIF